MRWAPNTGTALGLSLASDGGGAAVAGLTLLWWLPTPGTKLAVRPQTIAGRAYNTAPRIWYRYRLLHINKGSYYCSTHTHTPDTMVWSFSTRETTPP